MRKVQAFVCNVLGILSLCTGMSHAQEKQQPRIALKLSPAAHEKQQADPSFITALIQRAQSQGFAAQPISTANISIDPLISPQTSANLAARSRVAKRQDPSFTAPDFSLWYQVQVVSATGNQARHVDATAAESKLALPSDILELIHKLHELPEVESVHALHSGPPPAINPSDDPRSTNQGYLDPAPKGIDARYAWGFPGGDGAGVTIVDMEQGWNLNHEDLAAANITLISGRNAEWFGHGTSVLGEMFMVDNQLGGVGIVPGAKGRVVSQWRDDWSYNTPAAILDAAAHMSFGDILLLEAQEYDPVGGIYYWPMEVADANFEAIRYATALGIIVVEAGCNGAWDLDAYVNLAGKRIFDRSTADYRESGAIMVGGSLSTLPHYRWYSSNHGSRMDVYAWAEGVDTADTDEATATENWYTAWFGGTSGASPMIVGAAAIVQGISSAKFGKKLSPLEIRQVLTTGGTPSSDPALDRIGVMPNLKAIIDNLLGSGGEAPDIYIRDHVGDLGNTTPGSISASPDIIVRQQPIPNPEAALGTGSSTEDNVALSEPVLAGHDHSIYIRLSNRGAATSSATNVTVYWSEPATLVTPNMWHEIGSISLASVPNTNQLTVSPALAWPASSLPSSSGHYCFVALAGTANDPTPALPTSFPDFAKFIRENNNAAWRNFNLITGPPGNTTEGAGRYHHFPVTIPGAFDAPREFALKAVGTLPHGSKVSLRMPQKLGQALGVKGCARKGDNGEDLVALPIKPVGDVDIGRGVLPAGSMAACELRVKVPMEAYAAERLYEFALVQMWEGVEVGRVTWRFGRAVQL